MEETEHNVEMIPVKIPNPLLDRLNKLPGITVRLPSLGLFYTSGELDDEVVDGEVTVFPMTTADELMMRSSDMLFQGTAIENVLKRCVPQIKHPLELLVSDIDYLLTQLRKVSYGSNIPIKHDCECAKTERETKKRETEGTNEYTIPIDSLIQTSKEIDPKKFNDNYKVTLSMGYVVTLQPLRFKDFLNIHKIQEDEIMNDVEAMRDFVAFNFASITKSIDGIEDKEMIKELYKNLPRSETELIRNKMDKTDPWGIEFTYTITCRHCKKKKQLTTQLNPVYFFILPSSPETKKS